MNRLKIKKPDDWHLHLREGAMMRDAVRFTARDMGRAIVMPNLENPLVNTRLALDYYREIKHALPAENRFEPLMTLYLTDRTTPAEIKNAHQSGKIVACKLYPSGVTTHAKWGVQDIFGLYPVFEMMQTVGMRLLIHGEVTDENIDVFDREAVFIEQVLARVVKDFPELRIVFEHITTKDAVDFVRASADNLGATITAHHLLANRNDMFAGGIRPHYYCLPVLKRANHQRALIDAATSGEARFFLGTDSAPHPRHQKESACGCAGIFTAHAALSLYTEVFERVGKLERLENFAASFGAQFYQLPENSATIILEKKPWRVPTELTIGGETVIPFAAGRTLDWRAVVE